MAGLCYGHLDEGRAVLALSRSPGHKGVYAGLRGLCPARTPCGGLPPPLPENRRADPHMGRPERDRQGEIGAHSHGEEAEAVAVRDLGGEREMGCRRLAQGR